MCHLSYLASMCCLSGLSFFLKSRCPGPLAYKNKDVLDQHVQTRINVHTHCDCYFYLQFAEFSSESISILSNMHFHKEETVTYVPLSYYLLNKNMCWISMYTHIDIHTHSDCYLFLLPAESSGKYVFLK